MIYTDIWGGSKMAVFKIASIFSNHMVLQRDKKITVWGNGVEESYIKVTLNDTTVKGRVKGGKWLIQLPSMEAGGPYTMMVTDGSSTIAFTDVMVGEVWFAGGQSNMELELKDCKNGKEEVAHANQPNIRFYNTLKIPFIDSEALKEEEKTSWHLCNENTAHNMSAVGYFYAKKLAQELNVTIGIIDCYWGGTSITCWMSREYLEKDLDAYSYIEAYEAKVGNKTDEQYEEEMKVYNKAYLAWCERVDNLREENPNISWEEINEKAGICPWPQPTGRKSPFRPAGLYETMVSRVKPYTIRGFIYYQGEEDVYKASLYGKLMVKLIDQWRSDWKDDCLPFLFVQLPMYIAKGAIDDKQWAILRDQQMKVFRTIKNTGMAVIIDCGEFDNIHPLDKQTVGYRLALQGLKVAYSIDQNADAPIFKDYVIEEDTFRLYFYNMGKKIIIKNGDVKENNIVGFEVAGEDLNFVPATATLDGVEILVSAKEIQNPQYVRYAWTNYGSTSVYSEYDLPLAPFTTSNYMYINDKKE